MLKNVSTAGGVRFFDRQTVCRGTKRLRRAVKSDAVILYTGADELDAWAKRVSAWRNWPILWWCGGVSHSGGRISHLDVDGVLFPGMNGAELHWALMPSSSHDLRRTQWQKEREQLLERVEGLFILTDRKRNLFPS